MSTINKMPLVFFEDLLEYDKSDELKDLFISNFLEEESNSIIIDNIDSEKGIIKYWGTYYDNQKNKYIDGFTSNNFEVSFNAKIYKKYKEAKSILDNSVVEIVSNGNSPNEFLNLQMIILKSLYQKSCLFYLEKPTVKNAVIALRDYIHSKYSIEIPKIFNQEQNTNHNVNPDNYSPLSFCWDSLGNNERIEDLTNLYLLLVKSPPIIQCTEEEFINAFNQNKVEKGIKWLLIGKNNLVSKSSLIYFINYLNDQSYINTVSSTELNKKIEYVFRDDKGNVLKNIRQSKNTSKDTLPFGHERLEIIFSNL